MIKGVKDCQMVLTQLHQIGLLLKWIKLGYIKLDLVLNLTVLDLVEGGLTLYAQMYFGSETHQC